MIPAVKKNCQPKAEPAKLVSLIISYLIAEQELLTPVAKRKREEDKEKKEKIDKGISNYFTKGPMAAQSKVKVWSHSTSVECC